MEGKDMQANEQTGLGTKLYNMASKFGKKATDFRRNNVKTYCCAAKSGKKKDGSYDLLIGNNVGKGCIPTEGTCNNNTKFRCFEDLTGKPKYDYIDDNGNPNMLKKTDGNVDLINKLVESNVDEGSCEFVPTIGRKLAKIPLVLAKGLVATPIQSAYNTYFKGPSVDGGKQNKSKKSKKQNKSKK